MLKWSQNQFKGLQLNWSKLIMAFQFINAIALCHQWKTTQLKFDHVFLLSVQLNPQIRNTVSMWSYYLLATDSVQHFIIHQNVNVLSKYDCTFLDIVSQSVLVIQLFESWWVCIVIMCKWIREPCIVLVYVWPWPLRVFSLVV